MKSELRSLTLCSIGWTSEAVVGLKHVREYMSGNMMDMPYYHCDLEHYRDEKGDAETMKNHILTARHKQAWLLP